MLPLDLLLFEHAAHIFSRSRVEYGARRCARALQCYTSILWLKTITENAAGGILIHFLGSELTLRFVTHQNSWNYVPNLCSAFQRTTAYWVRQLHPAFAPKAFVIESNKNTRVTVVDEINLGWNQTDLGAMRASWDYGKPLRCRHHRPDCWPL